MKKGVQTTIASAILASGMAASVATADGHNGLSLSANMGIMSDYIFRGTQISSGTANGGFDLGLNGFYLGTWAADANDGSGGSGIEVDVYGGYIHRMNGAYLGAGYTTYQFTNNDTPEDNEVNIYAGYEANGASLDLEYSFGERNDDEDGDSSDDDYDVFIATVGYNGVFASWGTWGDDYEGDFWAVGYTMELAGFELTAGIGGAEEEDGPEYQTDGDTRAFAEISWGWDIL